MSTYYADDYLIDLIKRKFVELGRTPKKREVEHLNAIINRFGSWNNAIEKAGLKVLKRVNYTEKQLIEFIQEKAKKLGRIPRKTDFSNVITIVSHFGTFSNAIRKAGMIPGTRTEEELLNQLKELKERLGKSPSVHEAESNGLSPMIYFYKFKTWNTALKLAEISINLEQTKVTDSNEELILKYINFCNKLNRLATTRDIDSSQEMYGKNVFENRFESITKLKKLVIDDPRLKVTDKTYIEIPQKYTTNELIMILATILKENKGDKLTINELKSKLKENNLPYINTFYKRLNTTKINELWDMIKGGD